MKFLIPLAAAFAMFVAVVAPAHAVDSDLPTWSIQSDTASIGSSHVSPRIRIVTGDEPATAWFEYGGSPAYGKSSEPKIVPANSAEDYVAGLEADYAGGTVYYEFHLETPTKVVPGYSASSSTRGPPAINLVRPSIEGSPYPGHTLICNPGVWNVTALPHFIWNGFTADPFSAPWKDIVFKQSIDLTADYLGKTVFCSVEELVSRVGGESVDTESVTIVPEPPAPVVAVTASAAPCALPPKVIRRSLRSARTRLLTAGCQIASIRHARSRSVKKGRVIRAFRRADGRFVLVISKGKKPRKH